MLSMNFGETLKNVGIALGGLFVMAVLFCLGMIFIVGATAVSERVAPWFPVVFWTAFWSRSSFLDLYHLFHLHDLSLPLAL
jgi:hypothetical protein